MRILFVSQYFSPDMGAPASRVHELSREWATLGATVTVLTAFPHHPTGVVPAKYRGKLRAQERVDGFDVIRTFIYAAANRGRLRRMASYLSFMLSAIAQGLFLRQPFDCVIATSPQILTALAGMVLASAKRKPFIMEVRDLWPDSIISVGALKRTNPLVRSLFLLEHILYNAAARIVIVSEGFRLPLLAKGVPENKLLYLPNGVDSALFFPQPRDASLARSLGLTNKLVAGYIGTHGMAHNLETILQSAKDFAEKGDDSVAFLFVGEGARKKQLKSLAASLKLQNCVFIDKVDKADVPKYYALCDVALVTLRRDPVFQTVLPSKMFEAMAMALPVILAVEGVAKSVLQQAECGIAVEPGDGHPITAAIEDLRTDPYRGATLGRNGARFVATHFNRAALAAEYLGKIQGFSNAQSRRATQLDELDVA